MSGPARLNPILWIETATQSDGWSGWALIPGLTWKSKAGPTWVLAYERRKGRGHSHGLKVAVWRNF